ncbi:MAG: VCBS repeat-containing protein [Myxococcales bacterium]|nr:VCBS repeat-containing protein [Myxococcales bacterium]
MLDLVFSDPLLGHVLIRQGKGNGDLLKFGTINADVPEGLLLKDLNKDGKVDRVVAEKNGVTVAMGKGNGDFGPPVLFPTEKDNGGIAAADLDGDKNVDLVTTNFKTSKISILKGSGMGGFGPATVCQVGKGAYEVALGDLNGDAKPDIVLADVDGLIVLLAK